MMKAASGARYCPSGSAPGLRESMAGRNVFKKRRPGEAVEGMVWWGPVWMWAFAIAG